MTRGSAVHAVLSFLLRAVAWLGHMQGACPLKSDVEGIGRARAYQVYCGQSKGQAVRTLPRYPLENSSVLSSCPDVSK